MATKTRRRSYKGRVKGNEWVILDAYLYKSKSVADLSDLLDISQKNISLFLNNTLKDLKQVHETNLLISDQSADKGRGRYTKNSWGALKGMDKDSSADFLELLSDPEDPILTEEERVFVYLLVYEGDSRKALEDSGLNAGLKKSNRPAAYHKACDTRIAVLKSKPNLRMSMSDLQKKFVEELDIGKTTIQAEMYRTIEQLRAQDATKNAPTIARLLQDLGKTEGIFVDRVETTEVSLDDSFRKMLEMRRERGHELAPVNVAQVSQDYEPDNVDDRQKDVFEPETWVYPDVDDVEQTGNYEDERS